jgi:hypothetical protein
VGPTTLYVSRDSYICDVTGGFLRRWLRRESESLYPSLLRKPSATIQSSSLTEKEWRRNLENYCNGSSGASTGRESSAAQQRMTGTSQRRWASTLHLTTEMPARQEAQYCSRSFHPSPNPLFRCMDWHVQPWILPRLHFGSILSTDIQILIHTPVSRPCLWSPGTQEHDVCVVIWYSLHAGSRIATSVIHAHTILCSSIDNVILQASALSDIQVAGTEQRGFKVGECGYFALP